MTGVCLFTLVLAVNAGILLLVRHRIAAGTSEDPQPPWSLHEKSGVAVLLLLATVLRIPGLDTGLWFDEIQTLVHYVRLPITQILTTFDTTNQHLLYSVLARFPVWLFGEQAWALRAPAGMLGVMSIGALVMFGRRVGSTREAFLVAGLLTVSYHHVWFSQNARAYTSLLLWTLVGSALFLDLLRGEVSRAKLVAYGVVMALAMYSHITTVFTVAAHGVVWGLSSRRGTSEVRTAGVLALLLSGTLSSLAYSPVVSQLVSTLTAPSVGADIETWQQPSWLVIEALTRLAGGLPGGWVTVVGGTLLSCVGLWSFWRRDRVATGIMVLPGLVTGATLLLSGHNLWPRFFFFSAGFAGLIAVRGAFAILDGVRLRRAPALATAALIAAAVGSLATVPRAWQPKQDFVRAAAVVDSLRADDDHVVLTDLTILPYHEWLNRSWEAVETPEALKSIESRVGVTWVLTTFPTRLRAVYPLLAAHLDSSYDTAAVVPGTVGGGAIVILRSHGPGPL
jgi:hypothetical protein